MEIIMLILDKGTIAVLRKEIEEVAKHFYAEYAKTMIAEGQVPSLKHMHYLIATYMLKEGPYVSLGESNDFIFNLLLSFQPESVRIELMNNLDLLKKALASQKMVLNDIKIARSQVGTGYTITFDVSSPDGGIENMGFGFDIDVAVEAVLTKIPEILNIALADVFQSVNSIK